MYRNDKPSPEGYPEFVREGSAFQLPRTPAGVCDFPDYVGGC